MDVISGDVPEMRVGRKRLHLKIEKLATGWDGAIEMARREPEVSCAELVVARVGIDQ